MNFHGHTGIGVAHAGERIELHAWNEAQERVLSRVHGLTHTHPHPVRHCMQINLSVAIESPLITHRVLPYDSLGLYYMQLSYRSPETSGLPTL